MRTLTAKLSLLAIMVAGFIFTGDLPRLLEQATGAASSAARGLASRPSPAPDRTEHSPHPEDSPRAPGETARQTPRAPGETAQETSRAPGETAQETSRAPGETAQETPRAPGETTRQTPRAPGETARAARPAPDATLANAARPAASRAVECVPLPPLCRGPVVITGLEPGDRVLVRVAGELLAFDLIDAATGEAIEHRHVVREDGTVHVSAREPPRRVLLHTADAPPAAGGSIRFDASAGSSTGSPISHTIGPIIAVGVDRH